MKELQRYAASKGVRVMMHHETSANAADYDKQLDEAFLFMVDNGYNSVKTGYVGYIIPHSECLMGGPMDYTPGIFETKMSYYKGDKPNEQVHTTLVKQLALYVSPCLVPKELLHVSYEVTHANPAVNRLR